MEKELTESKATGFDLENESITPPPNRHEIAQKPDSFPRKKETNPPAQQGVESETPPSEEKGENKEGPSPLEGRVAELEQCLETEEGLRREGEEKLSGVQKALAKAVSRDTAASCWRRRRMRRSSWCKARPLMKLTSLLPRQRNWWRRSGVGSRNGWPRAAFPPGRPQEPAQTSPRCPPWRKFAKPCRANKSG